MNPTSDSGAIELTNLATVSAILKDQGQAVDSQAFDIFAPSETIARIGFYAQYFAVGLIYGGLPATSYGFFLGYLNVPAYVYSTVLVIMMLPWSFKFLLGMLNDIMPIGGLHRKPYMAIGWSLCALHLFVLWMQPMPQPYWCVDEDGSYVTNKKSNDAVRVPAEPCHKESKTAGGHFAILMMLAALGYVIADVAADGLIVEYAKVEPTASRGTTQTSAYFARTIGSASATGFIALFMNSKLYNGSFSWGLSFTDVCGCLAIPACAMVPISLYCVREPTGKAAMPLKEYGGKCWQLLCGRAFTSIVLYQVLSGLIGGIWTTAGGLVKKQWAGVQNFQNQIFSLVGSLLFASGLALVQRKFLHVSWHVILATTTLGLAMVDFLLTTLTIFDVVRNQYFYLGEGVILEVPSAANFVVSTFIIVEMADDGNEGLVYGLLSTATNLGGPLANAISNQLFRNFHPSLSDGKNYISDTSTFRRTVFASFVLSYAFQCSSLVCLVFLPKHREQAQHWKRSWPKSKAYGALTVVLMTACLCYAILVDMLSMFPSTMCLKFAGGDGCNR